MRTQFAPEYRQQELNEFATDVDANQKAVTAALRALQPGPVLTDDVVALRFGALNRLSPRSAMTAQLPRVAVGEVNVAIMSAAGAVTFVPSGALVNGATSFAPGAAIGLVRFVCDGTGWWV